MHEKEAQSALNISSLLRGKAIFLFGAVDNKYCGSNQCNVYMCCCDQSLEWENA